MNLEGIVINADKDVAREAKRKRTSKNLADDPVAQQLKTMELGDSFFLAGVLRKDTRGMVNLGKKVGVFLIARYTEADEIYQQAGTRLWRVTEEEMPRHKPKEQPRPPLDDDEI